MTILVVMQDSLCKFGCQAEVVHNCIKQTDNQLLCKLGCEREGVNQGRNEANHECIDWQGPLTRYAKLRVAHAPGMTGKFSPPPRVSDPDMHHDTCVTRVPWCMPGLLTSGFLCVGGGESVPGIPGACATCNFTYLLRGPLLNNLSVNNAVRRWSFFILISDWITDCSLPLDPLHGLT